MRDELKEQLSALVDDELRPGEVRFLLRRLGREQASRTCLGRYFVIRETLRGARPGVRDDLTDRVASALAAEPEHGSESVGGHPVLGSFVRPVAGMGVAAAVALVTVGLWPSTETPVGDSPAREVVATGIADPGGSMNARLVSNGGAEPAADTEGGDDARQWQRLRPDVRQRLNSYVVNHSEHSSAGRFGGVLTYVRIAGHETDQ